MKKIKMLFGCAGIICMMLTVFYGCTQEKQDMSDAQSQMQREQGRMEESQETVPAESLEKVYVTEVNVTAEPNAIKVEVEGSLPEAGFSFERFDVVREDDEINITPFARRDKDSVAAQQLGIFKESYRMENLEPGTYTLKVFGVTDSIFKELTISEATAEKQ